MIRFGLRLTLRGGPEAAIRLVVIAAAVALGRRAAAGHARSINAVDAQNVRYAWLQHRDAGRDSAGAVVRRIPLWGCTAAPNFFDGEQIARVDVAATGPPLAGAAGHPGAARAGGVLRLAGAGRACCARPRRRSSATGYPGGWSA